MSFLNIAKKSFERDRSFTYACVGIAVGWYAGNNAGNWWGGAVIGVTIFAIVLSSDCIEQWRRDRKKRDQIGTIQQRPHLIDYHRILLVDDVDNLRDIIGSSAVVAQADLILTRSDRALKDRHGPAMLFHPGLFSAAKLLPGTKVLDLTDDATRDRVEKEVADKAGRGDLWGFPLEIVRNGSGW